MNEEYSLEDKMQMMEKERNNAIDHLKHAENACSEMATIALDSAWTSDDQILCFTMGKQLRRMQAKLMQVTVDPYDPKIRKGDAR